MGFIASTWTSARRRAAAAAWAEQEKRPFQAKSPVEVSPIVPAEDKAFVVDRPVLDKPTNMTGIRRLT